MVLANSVVGRQIESYFDDNWDDSVTKIQYQNRELDVNSLTSYIVLELMPINSEHRTINVTKNVGERRDYILIVHCYIKRNIGAGSMETIVDSLDDLLDRENIYVGTTSRIQFHVPVPPRPTESERPGWMQWDYNIPFTLWT